MAVIKFAWVPRRTLNPYAHNPKDHSDKQIDQVADSIQEFGFLNPIIIDESNNIVAGHARFLAAEKLGHAEVPVIQAKALSPAQVRAYRIADNKLAEKSKWNESELRLEIEYLDSVDFNIEVTGLETGELDLLLGNTEEEVKEASSLATLTAPNKTLIKEGDIFTLGEHRIVCGDCRDHTVMSALMNGMFADMICSDPPYNVKINGHVLTKKDAHDEFAHASGEMTSKEFTAFLAIVFGSFIDFSKDGSIHTIFMDWRHMLEMLTAGQAYDDLLNVCVWAKTNAGMGSLYRSQHELAFVFKNGKGSHQNNVQLGKFGRNRSNVWFEAGMNSFGCSRDELLAQHPTVKPIKLISDAILDVTRRGNVVLDGFLGSGTTLLAAEQTGRVGYGCEISPQYVEVAIKRFQAISDKSVIHEQTGLPFETLIQSRTNQ
jgi:DNA modification methylase